MATPASTRPALEMILDGLSYLAAADPTALAAQAQAECLQTLEQAHAIATAARARILAAFTAGLRRGTPRRLRGNRRVLELDHAPARRLQAAISAGDGISLDASVVNCLSPGLAESGGSARLHRVDDYVAQVVTCGRIEGSATGNQA